MKNKLKTAILNDQFEDHKIALRLTIAVNALISLFLIVFNRDNPYLIYCLATALFMLAFYLWYSWKEVSQNLLILMLYYLIVVIEIILLGIPKQVDIPEGGKGVFMDLTLFVVPFVYIGLRVLAGIPLIRMLLLSLKIKEEKSNY